MAGIFLRLFVPGAVTVIGGTALAFAMTSAPIATDLGDRTTKSLAAAHLDWASVRIDGRDAILSGTATNQQMIDDAMQRVAEVEGVRAVSSEVILAEFVSPFPFAAAVDLGTVTLSGGYPSEDVHTAILAAAGETTDTTRLLSGAPEAAAFEVAAKFGIDALKRLDQGTIQLADLSLSISGRARSIEDYGVLEDIGRTVPAGVELASLTITPPLASPYVWTARFDGVNLSLSGNVPDQNLETELRALPPSNVKTSTDLELASGAPEGFNAKALDLLRALLQLEHGQVSIADGVVDLSGAPESAAVAERVTAVVAAMEGTVTLEPPRVSAYSLAIDKSDKGLGFAGFVPDTATRDKLAAISGADVADVKLGRGAPERFSSGVDFGLDLLSYFSEGRFELNGDRLSVGGRAATIANFKSLFAKAEEGAPQGFTLQLGDVRPPIAKPFTFTADKAATGGTTMAGFMPSDAVRADLHTKVADLSSDATEPADGAPDNFAFLAGKGLEVLDLLDTGTLSFNGTSWAIDGIVDTPQKGFAADAVFSAAGLRTLGWTYTVRLPARPVISPYAWRAQKAASGDVSFSGFSPSQTFKSYLKERVPAAIDASAIGAGEPVDFDAAAAAGLDALLKLDEGSLGLNGTRWTLTGEVADAASRNGIQSALAEKIDAANWQIAIQARDSAPVVTPYLWSATKGTNGLVDLTGYLPNATLQTASAASAVNVGRDTTTIASGEPAGFADDLMAGLDALTHMSEGRAAFDGSRWVLTGSVTSQEQGEAALAALTKGSRQGSLWTSALSGYAPPSAVSEQAPSSSELQLPSSPEAVAAEPVISTESSVEAISSEAVPSALSSSEPEAISSSSSSAEPMASSEQPPEMASGQVSFEELSSVQPSSPEPASASSEPSSSEPVSSAEPSSEISSAEPVSEEPPAEDRSLIVVDPLPSRFVFEANKEGGQPIVLTGGVPSAAIGDYFGKLAGDAPVDGLVPQDGLLGDFIGSGTTGLKALVASNEGRLGFDGTRWWLRGMVEDPAVRDQLEASIAALPRGADWSVFIGVLSPLEICRERVATLERRNAITFKSGSAALNETSLPVIDELALDLKVCPDASVHVEGHTDADGAEDLNLALSVARAETVVEELITRGVNLERLYAEGYGESQPIADNETRDGKAANRRIAFTISEE